MGKVFKEIGNFDPSQSFKIWLRKIVINTSIYNFRRNNKKILFSDEEAFHIPDETPNIINQLTVQDILGLLNFSQSF